MTDIPRLFGTDGIRDVAGHGSLRPERVVRIGRALGRYLSESGGSGAVLLGRDPRESGPMITGLIGGGLQSEGIDIVDAGVVPTPALAFLTKARRFALGIMISASHNPAADNGIKVFSSAGEKLSEDCERRIETFTAEIDEETVADDPSGAFDVAPKLLRAYRDEIVSERHASLDLRGMRIAIDCAHGAGYRIAPMVLRDLGAAVVRVGCRPDGKNINRDHGATSPERIRKTTIHHEAAIGIALDGDGDRVVLVDENGKVHDGDEILYILARHLKDGGNLAGDTVVATVMSNIGLEIALRERGIRLLRTHVGDKYVAEEMRSNGFVLGGEQSGHIIIDTRGNLTGDGLASALAVLEVMNARGKTLGELCGEIDRFPQVLENVRVTTKPPLDSLDDVRDAVRSVEDDLDGRGRVLLRYSGTEPLARVMVEGPERDRVREYAERIAGAIRERIGSPTS